MFRYEIIAHELRSRIEQGAYPTGRLPAERAMSEEFRVQRDTIRSALDVLIRNGLLLRDSTRGTYVAPWHLTDNILRDRTSATATGTVLLSVRTFDDTLAPTAVFSGLSRSLGEKGVSVFWYDAGDKDSVRPEDAPWNHLPDDEVIRARNVGGIALWPQAPDPMEQLGPIARGLPTVIMDRRIEGFTSDFVGFADFDAGRDMTRHLLTTGHRRIGFLSGEAWASTVQAREQGYIAALTESGGTLPTVLHREGGRRVLDGQRIHEFLSGNGDPLTAVICSNDIVAARLIQFLRSEGLRVPEDVAVTGFGDLIPSMLDAFGITTVAQPFEEMGKIAGEMLLSRMTGEEQNTPPRHIELPMRLIVRESCGSRMGARASAR